MSCPRCHQKSYDKLLRATILFPLALQLKCVRVHQKNAAGAVSAGRSECAPIDAVGPAMNGMGRGVARLLDELFRLDHLHDFRLFGVRLGIQDVNPRRPDARHDQVATLHVRMRGLRAKTRAAGIPAEVVQLIIAAGKIGLPDEPPVLGGTRIEVNDAHGVVLSILAGVEQRDISEAFWRGLHRHAR